MAEHDEDGSAVPAEATAATADEADPTTDTTAGSAADTANLATGDRDGAVGAARGTCMEHETVTDGQRWRREKRARLGELVEGPFTLGGEPRVRCIHCAAMLWPAECSTVFPASVEDEYVSEAGDTERPLGDGEEYEVEAVLARRAIPGDHCFFTGEAFEYKLKWRGWPLQYATWESERRCEDLMHQPDGGGLIDVFNRAHPIRGESSLCCGGGIVQLPPLIRNPCVRPEGTLNLLAVVVTLHRYVSLKAIWFATLT